MTIHLASIQNYDNTEKTDLQSILKDVAATVSL